MGWKILKEKGVFIASINTQHRQVCFMLYGEDACYLYWPRCEPVSALLRDLKQLFEFVKMHKMLTRSPMRRHAIDTVVIHRYR
jgi:hypothetical protein